MAERWSSSVPLRELLIPVGATPTRQPGRALERGLREAIRSGRLPGGTTLPSSRDLARQLGVARGTVTSAYRQLVGEGYLTSRHGSGTRVNDIPQTAVPPATAPAPPPPGRRLLPGLPALGAFPRNAWLACVRAALADLPDTALGYPDPAGIPELRSEVAAYLGRVRSVATGPGGVVITHGTFEGLALFADALRMAGHDSIAVEDPSHPAQLQLFRHHGLPPVPVPVDGEGIQVTALAATGTRAVLVTSAHQYPLGVVLSPARRRALLAWAHERDGFIAEDDYDAEYRYDRPPLAAVQALDPGRVAYFGTVSKTLAPAVRLGWMVPPPALLASLVDGKRLLDRGCSPLQQATLAHFVRTGGYDRHLRRTRLLYRQRRDVLLTALADRLPHWQPGGIAAGLHLVLRLPVTSRETELVNRLADRGLHVSGLSSYVHEPGNTPYPGLVLGWAGQTPDQLRSAVGIMAGTATDQYLPPGLPCTC